MRRQVLLSALALAALATPVAMAQAATKQEIIDRSGAICGDALVALAPHLQRMREAQRQERVRKFIRHGRRLVRTGRRFQRRLGDLRPPAEGRKRYRRFVNNTGTALDWLDGAFDALADRRGRLARRRSQTAQEHLDRARRAARRYGLRDSCIEFVS